MNDEYKIYTFDYPGGLESKYMEDVTYNEDFYSKLVDTFINKLSLSETKFIHLVGYSFGCSVLANYLILNRTNLDKIGLNKKIKNISFICPT